MWLSSNCPNLLETKEFCGATRPSSASLLPAKICNGFPNVQAFSLLLRAEQVIAAIGVSSFSGHVTVNISATAMPMQTSEIGEARFVSQVWFEVQAAQSRG